MKKSNKIHNAEKLVASIYHGQNNPKIFCRRPVATYKEKTESEKHTAQKTQSEKQTAGTKNTFIKENWVVYVRYQKNRPDFFFLQLACNFEIMEL